jgi:hypothetical protein
MAAPQSRYRQPKQLDAGDLQPEISSFGLHLAAEGKAARTIRTYVEAVAWFAAHLLREAGRIGWEQVGKHDVQQWMVRLLDRYSAAYASNQFRALQQFFKWLAAEEEIGDPMAGLRPPHVPGRPVPVFAGGDLARSEFRILSTRSRFRSSFANALRFLRIAGLIAAVSLCSSTLSSPSVISSRASKAPERRLGAEPIPENSAHLKVRRIL